MRRLALVFLFVSAFAPALASAQATLINGLGGTAGYGTNCIGMNDDGSSNAINISAYFPGGLRFFDRTHNSIYVNTNGNITFSDPLPTFTPDAFPVADRPMIAPYWADVDTRTYRSGNRTCNGPGDGAAVMGPACDNPAENGIWYYFEDGRLIVTWDRVGRYQCRHESNKRMSFQLVLTAAPGCAGGGDFDVEFRYNRCEWHVGDASGDASHDGICQPGEVVEDLFGDQECVPGQAGFDAGNTRDFVEIMGSRTASIHTTLCTGSNVGEPGVWRFQIRSGVIICPDAGMECNVPGQMGVCATGRLNCVGAGTECVQDVTPSEERCDALDNDCDGTVDNGGDALCPTGQVCESGVCLAACFELGCPMGQVCLPSGNCIDEGCEDIMCPDGQRCEDGACVGACDGVVCPAGQSCRGGSCVNLCAGLMCDDCTVCEDGACVERCPAAPCGSGETCQPDGSCVETSCVGISCPTGAVCRGGSCVDACMGAVCPDGMECTMGECVNIREVDAGPPPPRSDAGRPIDRDSGSLVFLDGGVDGGRRRPGGSSPGCGCHTVDRGSSIGWVALAAVALAWYRRRRGR
jgi:MYXO-CTERM domain-containing protein